MTNKLKPDWAGQDLLSKFVNLLIQTKPIYKLMKSQARQVLIKTAEKNGVPWRQKYQELEASGAKNILENMTNSQVEYPDYYQVPFHAYDKGNLCWEAAFEASSATLAMGLRVWPKENMTWETAQARLRGCFHKILGEYSPANVKDVLDIGCSVGISTITLHRYFSEQQQQKINTVGLDLSPYMLAVAKTMDELGEIAQWIHAKAEETGLPDNSFDVVTLQFLVHELPRQATKEVLHEMLRVLRPGGCLAIVDNNPKSPVIQSLPPALFVLMKSTEPWSDDYYTFDLEEAIKETGFEYKTTIASDPRHRTVIATKLGT